MAQNELVSRDPLTQLIVQWREDANVSLSDAATMAFLRCADQVDAVLREAAAPVSPAVSSDVPQYAEPLGTGDRTDWISAAKRLGEMLAKDGPDGYYRFTPDQWLAWAREQVRRPQTTCASCGRLCMGYGGAPVEAQPGGWQPNRQKVRDELAMLFGDTQWDRDTWARVSNAFDTAWPGPPTEPASSLPARGKSVSGSQETGSATGRLSSSSSPTPKEPVAPSDQ